MVFTLIEAVPGLTRAQRRRVARDGPIGVLTRTSYPSLLASAGFVDVEFEDRTAAYRAVQQRWIEATTAREAELRRSLGDAMYDDRIVDRDTALGALDDGLIVRTMYAAARR